MNSGLMNVGLDWMNPPQSGGGIMNPSSDSFVTPFSGDGGAGGGWTGMDFGQKMGAVTQGLGAFSSLANIYAGFKAMKLEKDKFKFSKDAWNKNYNAQVKDYENTLKDRWAARRSANAARGQDFQSMSTYVGERALAPNT